MAKRPKNILHILDTLKVRTDYARELFSSLLSRTPLAAIIGKNRHWAIVGGAVRDTLISIYGHNLLPLIPWSDIDIAVIQHTSKVQLECNESKDLIINWNHFGGLKLIHRELGEIDVWAWDNIAKNNIFDFWVQKLESVDFGLNAVAFIWPECRIIKHPQWEKDLQKVTVDKLYANSPRRELQPLRALALMEKLSDILDSRVKIRLGQKIRDDLKWLIESSNFEQVHETLIYLKRKLETRRWKYSIVSKLQEMCVKYNGQSLFLKELDRFSNVVDRKYEQKTLFNLNPKIEDSETNRNRHYFV